MQNWLRSIDLAHHGARFAAEGISLDQCHELTEEDLRELGLTMGERKRFRAAALLLTAPVAAVIENAAERRPLSMMFVDLVGSTQLGEQLDPEDLMELLRRYREFCSGPIARFGGHVARVVGDGILAYFCYPLANENDPERAVRAALDIAAGVGGVEVPGGARLAVRIGIATGPVVVGDLLSGSEVDRNSVIGSAPNLAARLQTLARPGQVVVAEETYLRIRDRFVCADLGSFDLRGLAAPRHAWQVVRELAAAERVSRHPDRATPLCGRAVEMATLAELWGRVRSPDGTGAAVLVSGEPGLGKSRLIETFVEQADSGGAAALVHIDASAFDADSPLRPVLAWLYRHLGGGEADDSEVTARLQAALPDHADAVPVLAHLLGLRGAALAADKSPEARRELALHGLCALLLAPGGRAVPVRLVIEDLHWLDPSTLDLVARLMDALPHHRAMLLVTTRESETPDWLAGHPNLTLMRLRRLDAADVAEMAATMLQGRAVPRRVLDAIARKADGVPLFVEEVVRSLALHARDDDSDPPIPASLHEALMGRLDRSGPAKEIAQAAAVVGRAVPRVILADICRRMFTMQPVDVDRALASLVQAGVLFRAEEGEHAFTHALLRDAAYDSLLRDRRRALHLHAAWALQRLDPLAVAAQPELLAFHFAEGEEHAASLPHWLEAGRRALDRSALPEATRLLRRGLAAADRLPADPAQAAVRLELMSLMGPALMSLKGPGSSEVAELYSTAHALCEQVPDSTLHFPIHWGWWRLSYDFSDKLRLAEGMLHRARAHDDPGLLMQAHHCAWASHFCAGNFARCCEHVEAGLQAYAARDLRHHARMYGNHDAQVCGFGELSLVAWMQGRPRQALAHEAQSLAQAERLGHVGSIAHARDIQLTHHAYRRDHVRVHRQAVDLVALIEDHGMDDASARGLIFRGWSTALAESAPPGLRMIEEGYARLRESGTAEDFPVYVCLLTEALIAAGQADRAVPLLQAAEAEFAGMGLFIWQPEVRRMRAEAMLAADDGRSTADAAARVFEQAIALAQGQGVATLALRAAVGLAQLDLRYGDPLRAAAVLHPAMAAIAEDDDGVDMIAARRLDAQLRDRLGQAGAGAAACPA